LELTNPSVFFRCSLDLSTLEPEKTHELWLDLEDGAGKIFLLVTISGKSEGTDLLEQVPI
jgi:hypothetical protein